MANPQEPQGKVTVTEREVQPAKAGMIMLSPDEGDQVSALMNRSSSRLNTNSPDIDVKKAAAGLTKCRTEEFCADDVAPPSKMNITRPLDIGGSKGTATLEPGKVKIRMPF